MGHLLQFAAPDAARSDEIAAYGTVRTVANQLGHSRAASLPEETLQEEKATVEKLTGIAESSANPGAAVKPEQGEGRRRSGGGVRSAYSSAEDRGSRFTPSRPGTPRSRARSRRKQK